jgi:hypothetical protein
MENNYLIEPQPKQRKLGNATAVLFFVTCAFALLIVLLLSALIVKQREIDAKNYQLEQRDILINSLTATNNELTFDNINLSNGK